MSLHIIQGDRKLPAQSLEHAFLKFLPHVWYNLRIAVGVEAVAPRRKFRSLLGMIEQLSVEDRERAFILVAHRLLAVRQSHDAQPPRGERYPRTAEETFLIRPSVK